MPSDPTRAIRAPYLAASGRTRTLYDNVSVYLYWLIVLCLGLQLALSWRMTGLPKATPGLRAGWVNVFKLVGTTLGILIRFRLWWRCRHTPPPSPAGLPRWQRLAAGATHRALYAAMVASPLSGYLGSNFMR